MARDDSTPPPLASSNQAVWGAVHSRRLIRRSALPRSSTTPNLDGNPAMSNMARNMNASVRLDAPLPSALVDRPATGTFTKVTTTPSSASPTPTSATEPLRRKGHGLFDVFKHKERPGSSDGQAVSTPPLPHGALMSPKAARLLGVEIEDSYGEGEEAATGRHHIDDGNESDSYPVLKTIRKSRSLAWLTRKQVAADRTDDWREENDGESDSMTADATAAATRKRSKKLSWKKTNNKALRMLDLIPSSLTNRSKASHQGDGSLGSIDRYADAGYHSDDGMVRRSAGPKSVAGSGKRRHRKRRHKPLEKMSPIVEASSLHSKEYDDDDDGAELEVISEYGLDEEHPATYARLSRSFTMPVMPHFESQGHHLSPAENVSEAIIGDDEGTEDIQVAAEPSYRFAAERELHDRLPEMIQISSPLQHVERLLLKNAEVRMELDAEKRRLEIINENTKHELMTLKARSCPLIGLDSETDGDSGTDSDIDAYEEPTIHTVQPMTFTRITPGMVKLVDIPPGRAQKQVIDTTKYASGQVEAISSYKLNGMQVPIVREPASGIKHSAYPDKVKPKRTKLPREESHILTKDWIDNTHPTSRRPPSTVDAGVPADHYLDHPPTPPPKEASPEVSPMKILPPYSPYVFATASLQGKHHCVDRGHIFDPIDLTQAPDAVAVNDLQVSPYLQTPIGQRQHVRIPVHCEKCFEDVKEAAWQCEIPVCRLLVCNACAEWFTEEVETRAIRSWSNGPSTSKTI